jgi:transposase
MPQPRFEQSMTSTVSQRFLSVTLWKGGPIALSTMADAVGSVCAALDPLLRLVEAHVMAAARLHADDTTVPVLANGKTDTGRRWI